MMLAINLSVQFALKKSKDIEINISPKKFTTSKRYRGYFFVVRAAVRFYSFQLAFTRTRFYADIPSRKVRRVKVNVMNKLKPKTLVDEGLALISKRRELTRKFKNDLRAKAALELKALRIAKRKNKKKNGKDYKKK
jgi:hypothetical protein